MTTSFSSSVDITDRSENFIHDRASQTIRPENENMEVEHFVDTSCDVRGFESMDIDDSDTILQERPGCVNFSPKKSILKDEYLAEQLFSSALLSEHIADIYDMFLTPLIFASSADVSKKTLCVISPIIRSDQSLHGYKTATRGILYLLESDSRGVRQIMELITFHCGSP